MKTTISVPDETFERVERRAAEIGVSRSEFYTRAARHDIQELDAHSLSTRIDAAVELVGVDNSAQAAVTAGRRRLAAEGDGW